MAVAARLIPPEPESVQLAIPVTDFQLPLILKSIGAATFQTPLVSPAHMPRYSSEVGPHLYSEPIW